MYRKLSLVLLAVVAMLLGATTVQAKPPKKPKTATATSTATLFGGAVQEASDVKLVSDFTDTSTANDFSGIRFSVPSGTTFADLKTLSAEFNPTAGGCGGGSPRFEIQLASGKNVFVYFGPSPNFTGCALNTWQSTGNLIGSTDACRYDTSQVQAGTQCNTYSGALALIGSQTISEIRLVVDSGWFFTPKTQVVLVRNVTINGQTFSLTQNGGGGGAALNPAKACRALETAMGKAAFDRFWGSNGNNANAFGKCVSWMAHHKTSAQKAKIAAGLKTVKHQAKHKHH
jgi:hypothetical protein